MTHLSLIESHSLLPTTLPYLHSVTTSLHDPISTNQPSPDCPYFTMSDSAFVNTLSYLNPSHSSPTPITLALLSHSMITKSCIGIIQPKTYPYYHLHVSTKHPFQLFYTTLIEKRS